ncbi:MAG TPA: response regulator transcription factor [Gaiellaceae bacterium]|jgi:DNA-binding response OmpR family regulator
MTRASRCGPILVVDDDESLLELLCVLLHEAGHEVTAVATGADAMRTADVEQPALAILDVCLPDVSGYEVCRRLRERWGNAIPILFVSGERTDTVDRVAGLLIGGDDYLVKPFASDELLARVASLIRRSEVPENGHVKASTLTPREHEVFQLIARGLPNAEIAQRLVISPKTVGTHIEHIYVKLGVRSRVEALQAGLRHELLTESSD